MNFRQMHERLRLELLRRVQRGSVSVSLLARQTGLGQSHLSNFLRSKRQLSIDAIDRILAAQLLAAADLLPDTHQSNLASATRDSTPVPVVAHATALFEPLIRAAAVRSMLHTPPGLLESLRPRATNPRLAWDRFVAVNIAAADALAMDPLVLPDAIVLLDRHYASLRPYRPNKPTLYAVRHGTRLTLRFIDFVANRLVLRPCNLNVPVELLEPAPGQSPADLLVGRVALIVNSP